MEITLLIAGVGLEQSRPAEIGEATIKGTGPCCGKAHRQKLDGFRKNLNLAGAGQGQMAIDAKSPAHRVVG